MNKLKRIVQLLLCLSLTVGISSIKVVARSSERSGSDPVAVRLQSSGTINIYSDESCSGNAISYIAGSNVYGGEVAFLEESSNAYKIRVSGVTGWIKKGSGLSLMTYDEVKSPSFYKVNDSGEYYHRISSNPTNNTYISTVVLGPKPDFMKKNTEYYSYDGIYFYTNYGVMVADYEQGHFDHAENADEPTYNYYQYLPIHSVSKVSGDDLNDYIEDELKFTSTPSSYSGIKANQSMLYDTGDAFESVQATYGTNMMILFGIAMNESGSGRSQYAIERNNLFGLGAFDADPDKASKFESIEKGIESFASVHMNWGYMDYNDFRYNGGHLGDKSSGINVKYASDPYWGEKAASYYYKADKATGLEDYGVYQIALRRDSKKMDIKKDTTSSKLIGSVSSVENLPYVILGEEGRYYKVLLDFHVDENRNVLKHTADLWFEPYNFENNYGYIAKSDVEIIYEGGDYPSLPGLGDHSKELSFDANLQKAINASISSSRPSDQVITSNEALALKTLKINDANLTSLEGISALKNLTEIEFITYSKKIDSSEISKLKKLTTINVHAESKTDLAILDAMSHDVQIIVTTQNIKGQSELPDLSGFASLTLKGSSISDASTFSDYPSKFVSLIDQVIAVTPRTENDRLIIDNPLKDAKGKSVSLANSSVLCDGKSCEFTYDEDQKTLSIKTTSASKIEVRFDEKLSGAVKEFSGSLVSHQVNVNADLSKAGWQQFGSEWVYVENGAMVKAWKQIAGKWYFFKDTGLMAKGWIQDQSASWYYLDYTNGHMMTGWQASGSVWYYLNPNNGIMQTNWTTIDGLTYYLGSDGAMRVGNHKVDGKMVAFSDKGVYLEGVVPEDVPVSPETPVDPNTPVNPETPLNPETPVAPDNSSASWQMINAQYYYVRTDGSYVKGWIHENGCWYLLDYNSGVMRTGWVADGAFWYYLNPYNGIMQTGWISEGGADYYCDETGAMLTGNQTIAGKQYSFNGSGILQ